MSADYDKVIEFFSEHETAIYGFGPTDYGAEEGTLLWCIKELDDIYNRSKGIVLADRGTTLKNQILDVLCALIDIYEKEDTKERELNAELKPCPFCDGKAELRQEDFDPRWMPTRNDPDSGGCPPYYVKCNDCGASTEYRYSYPDAVELWNRRSYEKAD